jgi:predicted alternative tryptophan synthase beta-subunit
MTSFALFLYMYFSSARLLPQLIISVISINDNRNIYYTSLNYSVRASHKTNSKHVQAFYSLESIIIFSIVTIISGIMHFTCSAYKE